MQTGIPPNQDVQPQPEIIPTVQIDIFGPNLGQISAKFTDILTNAVGLTTAGNSTLEVIAIGDKHSKQISIPGGNQFENAQIVRFKFPIYNVQTRVTFSAGGSSGGDSLNLIVTPKVYKVEYTSSTLIIYYTTDINALGYVMSSPDSPYYANGFRIASVDPAYTVLGGFITEMPVYEYRSQPIEQKGEANVRMISLTTQQGTTKLNNRKPTLLSRIFRFTRRKPR